MYGYATASYYQNSDHLKFWLAHTAVKTVALKGKKTFLAILDELTYVWGNYE